LLPRRRGLTTSEGDLRGINLNYRPARWAANVLPGTVDTDAPDVPVIN